MAGYPITFDMRNFIILSFLILISCDNKDNKNIEIYQNLSENIQTKLDRLKDNLQYSAFLQSYGQVFNVVKIDNELNAIISNYNNNLQIDTTINNYFTRMQSQIKMDFILIDKKASMQENLVLIKLNELNLIDNISSASSKYRIGATNYTGQYTQTFESDSVSKGKILFLHTDTIPLQSNPYLLIDNKKVYITVTDGLGVLEINKKDYPNNFDYSGNLVTTNLKGDTILVPIQCFIKTKK